MEEPFQLLANVLTYFSNGIEKVIRNDQLWALPFRYLIEEEI
jgi:hypothetical protein